MTSKLKIAAAFLAVLAALTLMMLGVADAQSSPDADPDDWVHLASSCDTNISGIPGNLSGVASTATGDIYGVTNGAGSLYQISGGISNQVGTQIPDPNNVLPGYDTEGLTWIDSSFTPANAGDYLAVAWERNPGNTIQSGMTIIELSPNIQEIATISLPAISNGAGNKGLEGIAFSSAESSASTWVFYGVKEEPAELYRIVYNVSLMTAIATFQGPLAVADAAGIIIDPSDSSKAFVLNELGASEIVEVHLGDGATVAGAGPLNPNAGGSFSQPEGITTEAGPSGSVNLVIVGEPSQVSRFSVDSSICCSPPTPTPTPTPTPVPPTPTPTPVPPTPTPVPPTPTPTPLPPTPTPVPPTPTPVPPTPTPVPPTPTPVPPTPTPVPPPTNNPTPGSFIRLGLPTWHVSAQGHSIASNSSGETAMVGLKANGDLFVRRSSDGVIWGSWAEQGAGDWSGADIAIDESGRVEIVAVKDDGRLFTRSWFSGGVFGPWTSHGFPTWDTAAKPSISTSGSRIVFAGIKVDGSLLTRQRSVSGSWTASVFHDVASWTQVDIDQAVDGSMWLVGSKADGRLLTRSSAGGVWGSFATHGAPTWDPQIPPSITVEAGNRVVIGAVKANGLLYTRTYLRSVWRGFVRHGLDSWAGVSLDSSPGLIGLAATKDFGRLHTRWFSAGSWGSWTTHGFDTWSAVSAPSIAAGDGLPQVLAVKSAGTLFTRPFN